MDHLIITNAANFTISGNTVRDKITPGIYSKKSALYIARNAVAKFTVSKNETSEDQYGNVITGKEELTYQLYIREEVNVDRGSLPGVDRYANTSTGYAVFPSKLDPRIQMGCRGTIVYGDQDETPFVVVDARFAFGNTGLIGSSLQEVLGDSIAIERVIQS